MNANAGANANATGRDENRPKLFDKNTLALALIATVGFGFLQGARLLDLNSGPYSSSPFALVGLAFDGCTFLAVALMSYFVRIESTFKLFWTGIGVAAAYAALIVSGSRIGISWLVLMQAASGMGWALMILCWMQVFTSYRPFHSLVMIALGYLIETPHPACVERAAPRPSPDRPPRRIRRFGHHVVLLPRAQPSDRAAHQGNHCAEDIDG